MKNTIDSTFTITPETQSSVSDSNEYTEANVSIVNGNSNTVVTYGTTIITNTTQDS